MADTTGQAPLPPPPPPPSPSADGAGATALWMRFRAWPRWVQALLWVTLLPVVLLVFTLTRPVDKRRMWWGLTAIAALFYTVAAFSPGDGDADVAAGGPPMASESSTTTAGTTTSERQTATTEARPAESPEGGVRAGTGDIAPAGTSVDDVIDRTEVSATDLDLLHSLRVAAERSRSGYDRGAFPHWDDLDSDGCDTRCEVLTAQVSADGSWFSEWDGATETDSSLVHVDHVVALAEAWVSGADEWTANRRDEFADDRRNLLAVTAASNLRKSDEDAAGWFPSRHDANCLWARTTVVVKAEWALSVDEAEKAALSNLLASCGAVASTTTAPPPTTAPPTTAAPATTAPPTTSAPAPSTVHPGAFCSPAGATGMSSGGVPMTCSTHKCDGTPYDQARWRKTTC